MTVQDSTSVIPFMSSGWFYDSTGSYIWPFVLFGVMLAISGIMLYPIPCIRRYVTRVVTQEYISVLNKCNYNNT